MEQQGGTEGFRRRETGEALAILSLYDPDFLSGMRTNLDYTLWRYGFTLSPQEMQEARDYLSEHSGLSDQEFLNNVGSLERYIRWR